MKKLLSLLGSVSMVGTAGATVVACGNEKPVETITEVSKQELIDLINTAVKILGENEERNPNPGAESRLRISIADAQRVVDTPNVDQLEVDTAVTTLKAAIDEFQKSTATDFSQLAATITKAQEVKSNPKNRNDAAEEKLVGVIEEAQKIVEAATATQQEVTNAVQKLEAAIEEFQKATATDFSQLVAIITKAQEVKSNSKNRNDAAEEKLVGVIEEAQKIVEEATATQQEVTNAVQKLEAAIEEFQKATATDKTTLRETIASAWELLKGNDNPNANEQALEEAIKKAEIVEKDDGATQNQVEVVNKALEDAYILFRQQQGIRTKYNELEDTIKAAEDVIKKNKNPNEEAQEELQTIIDLAISLVDGKSSSQIDVDNHVKLLKNGIKKFQEATKTDFTKLKTTIALAKKAIADNKNPNFEAQKLLVAEINTAQGVADDVEATQDSVNKTIANLDKAIQDFKQATDTNYSGLNLVIKEARKVLENNTNPNANKTTLQAAIEKAQAIVEASNASQTQVDTAIINLTLAIKTFKETRVTDNQPLINKIEEAEKAIENNVNPNAPAESVLKIAIELSKIILSSNPTQDSVDQTVINLNKAIQDFKEATDTDYSDLVNKINAAQGILESTSSINAKKNILETAIEKAQKIVDSGITQKEVDAAMIELEAAINAFVETAVDTNNSILKATIADAIEAINSAKHPDANGAKWLLDEAIAFAQSTVNRGLNVSQDEVNEVQKALEQAIDKFNDATTGELLETVLQTPKKLWLNSELFDSFANNRADSKSLSQLVWTGMLDARYKGDDESAEAKKANEASLKEFKDKKLDSIIKLEMSPVDIESEAARTFGKDVITAGKEYLSGESQAVDNSELKNAVKDLENYLKENEINSQEALKLASRTISAIETFKSKSQIKKTHQFNLVINNNENIKLNLEEDLVAYFTSGGNIKPTLIEKGNEAFSKLTLILTI